MVDSTESLYLREQQWSEACSLWYVYLTLASMKCSLIIGMRASTFSARHSPGNGKPACGPSEAPTAMTLELDDFLFVTQRFKKRKMFYNMIVPLFFLLFKTIIIITTLVCPCWSRSGHTWRYMLRRCSRRPWSPSWTSGLCGRDRRKTLEGKPHGVSDEKWNISVNRLTDIAGRSCQKQPEVQKMCITL